MAKPDWITISQNSGESGVTIITVEASSYSGLTNRTGQLTISSVHTTAQTVVNLSQKAFVPTLSISPSSIVSDWTGGTYELTISSDYYWSITKPDWLDISQNSGFGDAVITVTFHKNYYDYNLNGSIVVTDSVNTETCDVRENAFNGHPDYHNYLTFVINGNGTIRKSDTHSDLYYSIDSGNTWNSMGSSTSVSSGDTVILKGNLEKTNIYNDLRKLFSGSTCGFEVKGNIMSIVHSDDFIGKTETIYPEYIFQNCTGLTSAEDLKLPSEKLIDECYWGMFSGCTSLVTAPSEFGGEPSGPGTVASQHCCGAMFSNCTSLVNTPTLPNKVAGGCYYRMFEGCTSLRTAPILPATELSTCFEGGGTGWTGCYKSMFKNCTSLINLPLLPASALTQGCYESMFEGCTSLNGTQQLTATTLASYCYQNMFKGCTAITSTTQLSNTSLATQCYYGMFEGCTSLRTAPILPATTLEYECYGRMFFGCSSLNYIKCLAEELIYETIGSIKYNCCTTNWVNGVASTGTFIPNPVCEWTIGETGIPEGWPYNNISQNSFVFKKSGETKTVELSSIGNWTATTSVNWISISPNTGGTGTTNINLTTTREPSDEDLTGTVTVSIAYDGMTKVFTINVMLKNYYEGSYMFFDVKSNGIIHFTSTETVNYSKDNGSTWISGKTVDISVNTGDKVNFKEDSFDKNVRTNFSGTTCQFEVKGNIMSMVYGDDYLNHSSDSIGASNMFQDCTGLTSAERLLLPNATKQGCYQSMFKGCTSLTTAPELNASGLTDNCYREMFSGCSSLNFVKCLAENPNPYTMYSCQHWLDGVSSTGTFVKASGIEWPEYSRYGIPDNWTVQDAT